jgi:hypothetical protein
MPKKKPVHHYINNKDFYTAMVEYKRLVKEAEAIDGIHPRVTHYIGECFMLIATKLSNRPNFIRYTFKEEMIGDGIENCLQYIDNFDPDKSKNPFAYFTQIIWFAFLRRIAKEQKNQYIKFKAIEHTDLFEATSQTHKYDTESNVSGIQMSEWSRKYMDEFIETFEETKRTKKKPKTEEKTVYDTEKPA